ncbi:hypothetical protein [Ruminococcus flavefaciens]|uniref:Uncharacterized protein n=1 Tax=Ruminococcus flavefaciens TaxID=1265 RepID=A0A315XZ92_RUMFL|nr:hypothetical protein [Ruminococcus flavefaciens]PWJ11968.1 hypothetical protein IE37_02233 [Ruminococcus flavefaciens]SSA50278.1 hypothetical protein SAMN02910325_02233 [Ruminococcus flavefaciens]
MDDTNLKTDSEYNNETDSANNPVRKKELDDTNSTSKKNKRFIIVVIVIAIIIGGLSPFIIDIESPNKKSEITADGLLGYIVSFISAAVTAVLALYAIYQTKQANDVSQKVLDIEKNDYLLRIRPFIIVKNYSTRTISCGEKIEKTNKTFIAIDGRSRTEEDDDEDNPLIGIVLTITNTTESFLTFYFDDLECEDEEYVRDYLIEGFDNIKNQKHSLMPGKSSEIVFYGEAAFFKDFKDKQLTLSFILENRFMHRYLEKFDLKCRWVHFDDSGRMKFLLNFNNYKIYKFEYSGEKAIPIEEKL